MAQITEQKCPSCGGPLRFDPARGKLVCDYCGSAVEIGDAPVSPAEPTVEGFDFGALNAQAADGGAQALPVYHCVSCGAEVIAPAEQIALTCPYCGNNIVLTDKVSGKLRPDGMLPFTIDRKSLPGAMNRFYKDKALLPKRFFSESTMGKVTGVYVPFWVFNGRMSGELTYRAEHTTSARQGDYIVTDTAHYRLSRDVDLTFENVPVDASGRIDDALMDSLEPFRMEDAKPFDMRYLAGFTADRFDRARDDIAERAESRMVNTAHRLADRAVAGEYESPVLTGGSLRADLSAKYMLFPVYLFDILHGGKSYHFAVNGQTGKVVGSVPTDKGVSFAYFLKRALPVAGGVLLLSFIRYMMGG